MDAERMTLRRIFGVALTALLIGMASSAAGHVAANRAAQMPAAEVTLTPASVHLDSSVQIPRRDAFSLAISRQGDWYVWGADGPQAFDCSGLVYWAYHQAGVAGFGRTTYQMLASGRLRSVPWSQAQPGDLVFFGTGHVELYVSPHVTFGALAPGTQIEYHRWYPGSWWVPTGVYSVTAPG
jgi:peptidoglycan DL-endopeptidase CwlO